MASKTVVRAVALILIVVAGGGAWWFQNHGQKSPSGDAPVAAAPTGAASGPRAAGGPGGGGGKPAVEVAKVEQVKLVDEAQATGSLRSRQNIMVRPEVSGRITQVNFRDGQRVSRGQLLIQLDDQLAQAQVKQAQAELSIAQVNFNRNKELVEQNFISRRTVDESGASLEVAQAKLALAKATADRLKILAPFDGTVGIRSINLGDYLKDGADVVNLEDMDAVYVDYRLPERFQTRLRAGQRAEVEVDAVPGRKFSAVVQAIDPLIDANGRSLGVRACIDNRRMQLRPGMFARVATNFSTRDKARVVPEEAIVPQGSRQFVIRLVDSPEGPVTQRVEVKVGMRTPGKVELLDGVAVGDTVVVAGQQRLQRDGTVVRVIEGAGRGGPGGPGGAPGAPGGPGAAAGAAPSGAGPAAGGPGRPPAGRPAANLPPLQGPDPCLVALDGSGRGAARPAGPAASPAAPAAVPARRSGPGPT